MTKPPKKSVKVLILGIALKLVTLIFIFSLFLPMEKIDPDAIEGGVGLVFFYIISIFMIISGGVAEEPSVLLIFGFGWVIIVVPYIIFILSFIRYRSKNAPILISVLSTVHTLFAAAYALLNARPKFYPEIGFYLYCAASVLIFILGIWYVAAYRKYLKNLEKKKNISVNMQNR